VKEPADATLPIKPPPQAVASVPKPVETPRPAEVKPVTPPKPAETHPVAAEPTSALTPAPSKPPVTVAIGPTSPTPPPRRTTEAFTRTAPPPASKSHTLTWVAAAGSALALGGGAVFGYKTYDAGQSSDASKANILYGVGAALAIASAAFFVLDF
jgi:hypothetical protein